MRYVWSFNLLFTLVYSYFHFFQIWTNVVLTLDWRLLWKVRQAGWFLSLSSSLQLIQALYRRGDTDGRNIESKNENQVPPWPLAGFVLGSPESRVLKPNWFASGQLGFLTLLSPIWIIWFRHLLGPTSTNTAKGK